LESVAALPAIANNAKTVLKKDTDSILNSISNITGISVLRAAAKGDRLASHIVDDAFEHISRAIAGIVNVVNPELIVFGSIIGKAGEHAFSALIRSLQKNILETHWNNLKIHICKIDSFLGPLGGAACVLDECLENATKT
jgi:glucokinase